MRRALRVNRNVKLKLTGTSPPRVRIRLFQGESGQRGKPAGDVEPTGSNGDVASRRDDIRQLGSLVVRQRSLH